MNSQRYNNLRNRLLANAQKTTFIFGKEIDEDNDFFSICSTTSNELQLSLKKAEDDYTKAYNRLIETIDKANKNSYFEDSSILSDLVSLRRNNFNDNLAASLINNSEIISFGFDSIVQDYYDTYKNLFDTMNQSIDFTESVVTTLRGEKLIHQLGILGNEGNFMQFFYDEKTYSALRRDRDLMQIQVTRNSTSGALSFALGTRSGLLQEDVLSTLMKTDKYGEMIYSPLGYLNNDQSNNPILSYFDQANPFTFGGRNIGLGRFNEDYYRRILTGQDYSEATIRGLDRQTGISNDWLAWWKGGDQNFAIQLGDQTNYINLSQKSLDFLHRNATGRGYTQSTNDVLLGALEKMKDPEKFQDILIQNWQDSSSTVTINADKSDPFYSTYEEDIGAAISEIFDTSGGMDYSDSTGYQFSEDIELTC